MKQSEKASNYTRNQTIKNVLNSKRSDNYFLFITRVKLFQHLRHRLYHPNDKTYVRD